MENNQGTEVLEAPVASVENEAARKAYDKHFEGMTPDITYAAWVCIWDLAQADKNA